MENSEKEVPRGNQSWGSLSDLYKYVIVVERLHVTADVSYVLTGRPQGDPSYKKYSKVWGFGVD